MKLKNILIRLLTLMKRNECTDSLRPIYSLGRTEAAGHEAERELGGEQGEEPGGSVQRRGDFVALEVVVEVTVVVVNQAGQLVQLDLKHNTRPVSVVIYISPNVILFQSLPNLTFHTSTFA